MGSYNCQIVEWYMARLLKFVFSCAVLFDHVCVVKMLFNVLKTKYNSDFNGFHSLVQ